MEREMRMQKNMGKEKEVGMGWTWAYIRRERCKWTCRPRWCIGALCLSVGPRSNMPMVMDIPVKNLSPSIRIQIWTRLVLPRRKIHVRIRIHIRIHIHIHIHIHTRIHIRICTHVEERKGNRGFTRVRMASGTFSSRVRMWRRRVGLGRVHLNLIFIIILSRHYKVHRVHSIRI